MKTKQIAKIALLLLYHDDSVGSTMIKSAKKAPELVLTPRDHAFAAADSGCR